MMVLLGSEIRRVLNVIKWELFAVDDVANSSSGVWDNSLVSQRVGS